MQAPRALKELWVNPRLVDQAPIKFVGEDMLYALRSSGGGIVYTKRNDFYCLYYVDRIVTYEFSLVPFSLIPSNEFLELRFTEIGKGWVRQEALDLFSYTYTETPSGHFCISGNLKLVSIMRLDCYQTSKANVGKG